MSARTIAIGDIHGCVHALDAVLEMIAPTASDTIVVLGDFVDQGWDVKSTIERLIQLESEVNLIHLLGNHEEMLLASLTCEKTCGYWENCGGARTLSSYRLGGSIEDIPDDHIEFIRRSRPYYETESCIFTHANAEPNLPMDQQPEYALRWKVLEPDAYECHYSGKTLFVGHTEQRSGEVLNLGCIQDIDTACWRNGWLTAIDVDELHIWQASRYGQMREGDEPALAHAVPAHHAE
ncbi:metallophosphoesterase [Blastopirellula sp. JC732]|uniref:Metallophosphoesterase n=1 Tax=Blastopirellula sediminis TaxID=2894196 RepID=A0A9X1MLE8_9BACT|nr:metallophosphoesterase [Blastopirellula sediminis]MCC9609757.1 metallophosphoesterase [Blastopirellula sediminis]MCC9629001.1 metallophosphoesterase [Blastopirellula sediminis]